jgi:transcriptional regulator with XRE-family HTH domain
MPSEIRFLRRQLGLSGIDLATHLGATPESVSRWEHGRTPMGVTTDRLLRLMVVVAQGTAYSVKALRVVARREPRATLIHVRCHDGAWEAMAG